MQGDDFVAQFYAFRRMNWVFFSKRNIVEFSFSFSGTPRISKSEFGNLRYDMHKLYLF